MDDQKQLPMTTSGSGQSSQQKTLIENTALEINAILSRLSLHYWRPDFGPGQVRLLLADYLDDLHGYSVEAINAACTQYRRNPENKFFPRSGDLLALLKPKSEPRHHLQPFRGLPVIEAPRATKTAAQILAEHGFTLASARLTGWDS